MRTLQERYINGQINDTPIDDKAVGYISGLTGRNVNRRDWLIREAKRIAYEEGKRRATIRHARLAVIADRPIQY